jgi:hypothetical protein
MDEQPPTQYDSAFLQRTVETSERLAALETQQESIIEQSTRLSEGQQEILARIDEMGDNVVTDEDLAEMKPQVRRNTKTVTVIRWLAAVGSVVASAGVGFTVIV